MAVASGPAGPVLAGPVLTVAFTPAHAQVINNELERWPGRCSNQSSQQLQRRDMSHALVLIAGEVWLEAGLRPRPSTGPLQKCLRATSVPSGTKRARTRSSNTFTSHKCV